MVKKSLGLNKLKLADLLTEDVQTIQMEEISEQDIAIIGMAGLFPEADHLQQFWENLWSGRDSVRPFPSSRRRDIDPILERKGVEKIEYDEGAYLDEIGLFDPLFFNISPKEASLMDPHQRIFLQLAWTAIEDAGYGGGQLRGSQTGVYVGFSSEVQAEYKRLVAEFDPASVPLSTPGNIKSIIASRISYLLDLKGPAMLVDTACSSTLTAIHLACQALKNHECEQALVGGVKVNLLPLKSQSDGIGIKSSNNRARTFDDASDGTGFGEGGAVLLLKPLDRAVEDRDQICGVIKGSALNQDGSSIGITAPNSVAQAQVLETAWKNAGIHPNTISYIEAHGTGTKLGDPIEIDGIRRAYANYTEQKQICGIGSVKTNIGHLDSMAGLAGMVKVILALRHHKIPPMLHFSIPNQQISFLESPVYVVDQQIEWTNTGVPRRAGVSSFGLSGTNCHVILEEWPINVASKDANAMTITPIMPTWHLLALSAKTPSALQRLLKAYQQYLKRHPALNLTDLCYTANTGRGHYTYRLAFLFQDGRELLDQLERCYLSQLVNHRVDLEGENQQSLAKRAQVTVQDVILSRQNDESVLTIQSHMQRLVQLYCEGAMVPWENLYLQTECQRISLPTYPFEQKSYWVSLSEEPEQRVRRKEIDHPLLDRLLADSIVRIYSTDFSIEKDWVLTEHKIMGNHIVPGTTYVEMARKIAEDYFPDNQFELRDLTFVSPLIVKVGEVKELQTVVKWEKDHYQFQMISRFDYLTPHGEWAIHAEGKIYDLDSCRSMDQIVEIVSSDAEAGKVGGQLHLDLMKIKERCSQSWVEESSRTGSGNGVYEFGPRWHNFRRANLGENDLLVELSLAEEYWGDLEEYQLHPSLLDSAVNVAIQSVGDGVYLPLLYKRMKVFGPMPGKFYSYLQRKGQPNEKAQTITFDIWLMDEKGQVFVEIEDYAIKRVPQKSLQMTEKQTYYQIGWIPVDLPQELSNQEVTGLDSSLDDAGQGAILIFSDDGGLGKELIDHYRSLGQRVIQVLSGREYHQITADRFQISAQGADYQRLLTDLVGVNMKRIFHLWMLNQPEAVKDRTLLQELENQGVWSAFWLARAIQAFRSKEELELVLISSYGEEVTGDEVSLAPHTAGLYGIGKVINQEMTNLRCRSIDLDDQVSLRQLFVELSFGQSPYQVAYRQGYRYIQQLDLIDQDSATLEIEPLQKRLRSDGIYIITGGLGGLGLEIGQYLSAIHPMRLVLVNRTPFPDREDWNEIVSSDLDSKRIDQIRAVRKMEAQGSLVTTHSLDISDDQEVQCLLDQLHQEEIPIRGIIHCAGVAGDGMIITKEEAEFREVLTPKIRGTWILDQLSQDDPLDFFVVFSSVTAFQGGAGQSDYTAANMYLDTFSQRARQAGRKMISINWPAWKETGMAHEYGVADDNNLFRPLLTQQALQIFDEMVSRNLSHQIPGNLNYPLLSRIQEQFPVRLSKEIQVILRQVQSQMSKEKRIRSGEFSKERFVGTAQIHGVTNNVETKVAQIWASILEVSELSIDDDFFQLGGHSLNATMLVAEINKAFDVEISVMEIFNHSTVRSLAKIIMGAEEKEFIAIESAAEQEYYPVSSAQKRMFILHQWNSASINYNLFGTMTIEGNLNQEAFVRAVHKLVERHEALRTSLHMLNGVVMQKVHAEVDFDVTYLSCQPGDEERVVSEFIQPFDLSQAPCFRVGLAEVADHYLLIFDMHHAISDGVSLSILTSDFIQLYQRQELSELRIQYKDFAVWQQQVLQSETMQKQEEYWLHRFSGELPVLNVPIDFSREMAAGSGGGTVRFHLDRELTDQINLLASEQGVTFYMILLAVYNLLLHKYTGQEDIVVGSPIAGRHRADLEKIIGMFANTLAMRNYPLTEMSFQEFLQEVKMNSLQAYENQDYQFEMLVEKLNLERDWSRNPIFDTMLVLQNTPSSKVVIPELQFTNHDFETNAAILDLTLTAVENRQGTSLHFQYSKNLFQRLTIERMAKHLVQLVREIVATPEKRLGELNMVTIEEKEQLLFGFNDTEAVYSNEKTIYQLFEEQVARTPGQIAVLFGEEKMTYQELNEQANQLAHLLRSKGVQPDQLVGIACHRSFEMMIGIMGILKAGGAYLPIDPEYPTERIAYMVEDSQIEILLTQSNLAESLTCGVEIICLDEVILTQWDKMNLSVGSRSNHLAYVIYTSGSTGKPKGVMVEHISVINRIHWMQKKYLLTEHDRILQKTPFTFDVSVWELFWWSWVGASVYFLKPGGEKDPGQMIQVIEKYKITTMHFVPSMLNAFLTYLEYQGGIQMLSSLHQIFASGEALEVKQVERFNQTLNLAFNTKLHNLYGPTEATVDVSYFDCSSRENLDYVPIGKPIDNTQLYVLNQVGQIQPIGVPGELYIAGDGLARGYLNQLKLTEERFVVNPFQQNQRMYKTGDLVRWSEDGNLQFLGRLDHQVKIRGFRIELGEIEAELMQHPEVRQVVVLAREDHPGDQYLCAYVIVDQSLDLRVLQDHLSQSLPKYMIPRYWIKLSEIPLTTNGKIDRKALPKPEGQQSKQCDYLPPTDELEGKLTELWSQILKIEQVGLDDNFLHLGGDSLKAIYMISELFKEFDVEIPMSLFFKKPTVRELAHQIRWAKKEGQSLDANPMTLLTEKREKHIFCFPPLIAYGITYLRIANQITDRSLYAFDFIEAIDRNQQYIELIQSVQPEGPYVLLGYSSGGNLAFEVAKEMQKQGLVVSDLIMLDALKREKPMYIDENKIAKGVDHLLINEADEEAAANIEPAVIKELEKGLGELDKGIDEMLNGANRSIKEYISMNSIHSDAREKIKNYALYTNSMIHTGVITANIHLITSVDRIKYYRKLKENWRQATLGEFRVYKGYGTHTQMLNTRYRRRNIKVVRKILAEIE